MDLITIDWSIAPAELQAMTVQDLRAELARTLEVTAQTLVRLAAVWRELEQRGEDLSDLRNGLAAFLSLIADGKLHPEVVVRFAGRRTLLQRLAQMPVGQQLALAHGRLIDVVVEHDGDLVETRLSVDEIQSHQLGIVFDGEKQRSLIEQRLLLEAKRYRRRTRTPSGRKTPIHVDPSKNQLVIGKTQVELSQVLAELRRAGILNTEDLSLGDNRRSAPPAIYTHWPEKDNEVLRRHYPQHGVAGCRDLLLTPRSDAAIRQQAYGLGLTKSRKSVPWEVAEAAAGPDYHILVRFADGLTGTVDLSQLVHSPGAGVFAALADEALFRQLRVESGVVTWPNGVDLAPDAMYAEIQRNGNWILTEPNSTHDI